eukprot:TRINITY_DN1940_c0_g1_i1.p1 TRINITY_DN1940_c0_g1~~TRINITY_DN1940_c0_g1_i1.p1  ORF type:complete len:261 (+),score=3.70 TRINITY_DN1940_c0_g1_i1:136-918(+)
MKTTKTIIYNSNRDPQDETLEQYRKKNSLDQQNYTSSFQYESSPKKLKHHISIIPKLIDNDSQNVSRANFKYIRSMSRKITSTFKVQSLVTVALVRRCISKFLESSQRRKFQQLGPAQFNLINDSSYSQQDKSHSNLSHSGLLNKLTSLSLFHPCNKTLRFLYFIYYIVLVISLVFYPIRISFNESLSDDLKLTKYVIVGFLVFHIFVKMNTGIFKDGVYIFERRVVFQMYLQSYLFIDVLGVVFEICLLYTSPSPRDQA